MNESRFWRVAFVAIGLIAAVIFVSHVWSVVVPFLFGLAISYLFFPLVDRFVAMGLRQDRVVLVLYGCLLGSGVLLIIFLLPSLVHQAQVFAQELPSYAKTLDGAVAGLNEGVRHSMERLFGHRARAFEIPFHAEAFLDRVFLSLPGRFLHVAEWGLWLFIVPFVSFFGLSQGRFWIDKLFQYTP